MYLVTVIVPVYKVETYLERCVLSIINQTYSNLEIILVDDGSPDNCPEICEEFSKRDRRIKVIHKKNGGLSDARNIALDIASGDLICFVDSDDWIELDMIEDMIEDMIKNNSDIVICGVYKVYGEKAIPVDMKELKKIYNKNNAMKELATSEYLESWVWNKIYKKNIFDNIRFPKDKLYEDVFIMHEVFNKAKTISILNEQKYYYVQREDSIVGESSINSTIQLYEAFKKRYFFIKTQYPQYVKYAGSSLRLALIKIFETTAKEKSLGKDINLRQLYLYRDELKVLGIKTKKHTLPHNRKMIGIRSFIFSVSPTIYFYICTNFYFINNRISRFRYSK